MLGHHIDANGLELAQPALRERTSKRLSPEWPRPMPQDRASPAARIGAIPFDGGHSCDPSDAGDRFVASPRQGRPRPSRCCVTRSRPSASTPRKPRDRLGDVCIARPGGSGAIALPRFRWSRPPRGRDPRRSRNCGLRTTDGSVRPRGGRESCAGRTAGRMSTEAREVASGGAVMDAGPGTWCRSGEGPRGDWGAHPRSSPARL